MSLLSLNPGTISNPIKETTGTLAFRKEEAPKPAETAGTVASTQLFGGFNVGSGCSSGSSGGSGSVNTVA